MSKVGKIFKVVKYPKWVKYPRRVKYTKIWPQVSQRGKEYRNMKTSLTTTIHTWIHQPYISTWMTFSLIFVLGIWLTILKLIISRGRRKIVYVPVPSTEGKAQQWGKGKSSDRIMVKRPIPAHSWGKFCHYLHSSSQFHPDYKSQTEGDNRLREEEGRSSAVVGWISFCWFLSLLFLPLFWCG